MHYFSFLKSILLLILVFTQSISDAQQRGTNRLKLNTGTLNQKVVGVLLKANGKRYYISSELCSGGIFLTRPVNENCLCYNGIFQIVRECCDPAHTRIHSDNLEWRMDFKCGTSPAVGNTTSHRPIRAILPLTKPYNRLGSVVMSRSLVGNNTVKWRKFDTEDIIVGNNGRVDMSGKVQFEIVNIKPLGREIKISFGKHSEMNVCYSGWLTEEGHQNLRVKVVQPGEMRDCCFYVNRHNSAGEITSNCTKAVIQAEIIDVQSADVDIGQCDQQIPSEAPHVVNKRNPANLGSKNLFGIDGEVPEIYGSSKSVDDDLLPDLPAILVKRNATSKPPKNSSGSTTTKAPGAGNGTEEIPEGVIIPRRKGISKLRPYDQAPIINEFIAILRNDPNVEIREPKTPWFLMLKACIDIFLTVVPSNVVPHVMIQTAFDVFFFLYEELEPVIFGFTEEFNKTMHYLHKCMKHEKPLNFTTSGCPPKIDELVIDDSVKAKLEGYYKDQPEAMEEVLRALKHVEIRKDKRFIPESFDIYVEINWKIIDFVHSLCFDYFGKEFNSHTYFETEMENLLKSTPVETRWLNLQTTDLRYVRGIFPVSDLLLSMKQLDRAVAIGHHLSRYNGSYWLQRPQIKDVVFNPVKVAVLRAGGASSSDSDGRLMFAKNLLDDAVAEKRTEQKNAMLRSPSETFGVSPERSLTYPFQFQTPIASGELIWDGMAVCLQAKYSNSRGYFVNSDLWGITPTLQELGQMYS